MKVLVCGGRSYKDRQALFKALDRLHARSPVTEIIHGCASGADMLAHEWAIMRGVLTSSFPAEWMLYGKKAGPIRNQRMLDAEKPDTVVAFPGGAGTADMLRRAKKAGVRVVIGA